MYSFRVSRSFVVQYSRAHLLTMTELITTHQDDILTVHAAKLTPGRCLSLLEISPNYVLELETWLACQRERQVLGVLV